MFSSHSNSDCQKFQTELQAMLDKMLSNESVSISELGYCDYLISEGASPNTTAKNGDTLLHLAVKFPKDEKQMYKYSWINRLLELNVNPDLANDEKQTVLSLELDKEKLCNIYRCKAFIKYGANLNIVNKNGDSLLHHAVKFDGSSYSISDILDLKVDLNLVNFNGETASSLAFSKLSPKNGGFSSDKFESCLKLMKLSSNQNIVDEDGNNLLHLTIKYLSSDKAFNDVIQLNIDPNQLNNENETALSMILDKNKYDRFDSRIEKLINKGANPNTVNKQGNTILHIAAKKENCRDLALANARDCLWKVDPTILNNQGETALFLLPRNSLPENAVNMICHGSDPLDFPLNKEHWNNWNQTQFVKDFFLNRNINTQFEVMMQDLITVVKSGLDIKLIQNENYQNIFQMIHKKHPHILTEHASHLADTAYMLDKINLADLRLELKYTKLDTAMHRVRCEILNFLLLIAKAKVNPFITLDREVLKLIIFFMDFEMAKKSEQELTYLIKEIFSNIDQILENSITINYCGISVLPKKNKDTNEYQFTFFQPAEKLCANYPRQLEEYKADLRNTQIRKNPMIDWVKEKMFNEDKEFTNTSLQKIEAFKSNYQNEYKQSIQNQNKFFGNNNYKKQKLLAETKDTMLELQSRELTSKVSL